MPEASIAQSSRVEIGLIAPFALDAYSTNTAGTGAETTAVRQPFIMSSQQYVTHGGVTGLQRSLRPLEVRAARKRARWCGLYTGALFHPYIIHGTRTLLPHHTHMIYWCVDLDGYT